MTKRKKTKHTKKRKTKRFSHTFIVMGVVTLLVGIWGVSEFYSQYRRGELTKKSRQEGIYRGVSGLHMAKFDQSGYRFRETKKVLEPTRYRLQKQMVSYGIAGRIPQVLDQIYCFCGCSHSIGHKSLLSCFTDDHAANCGICMDQAILAGKMADREKSIIEIVDAMDTRFH